MFGQPDLADRARRLGAVGGRAVLAGHRAGQLARLPAVRVGIRRCRADASRARPGGDSGPRRPRPAGRRRAAIVQRGCDRKIIDLASGVRWERLTPQSEAMTDFLEVIYSPGGHSTDERRPLRHDGREYGLIISGTLTGQRRLRELRAGPGRLDRVRCLDAARVPQQDRRGRARDLGRRAFRARPGLSCHRAVGSYPADLLGASRRVIRRTAIRRSGRSGSSPRRWGRGIGRVDRAAGAVDDRVDAAGAAFRHAEDVVELHARRLGRLEGHGVVRYPRPG